MSPGNPARLLKLADREFRQIHGEQSKPRPSKKFKPIKLAASRFERGWERRRLAAVQLTVVLLREDDTALERRVCENERTVKTYIDAADWLQRESAYLLRIARLLDTAGTRLDSVLTRCQSSR